MAYRLNILGFFTTTDPEAPGNYGIFDQIAALDWVKRKIKYFNGSPDNIVIYGHSSGAISVGLHMLSPLSRGKFNKAIAMSGDAINSVRSPEMEAPVVNLIADKFGCYRQPTSALMECLRRLDASHIVKYSSDIESWGPIVDAETNNETVPFLSQHPKDILDSGNCKSDSMFKDDSVSKSKHTSKKYFLSIYSPNLSAFFKFRYKVSSTTIAIRI